MVDNTLSSLATALFSTYLLIILGFVIVKLDIIRQADVSTGIGKFTGLIALPALLFRSIATLDLGGINWKVVAGVALAKATIFFLVALFSLLLDRSHLRASPAVDDRRDSEEDMEELQTVKEEKENSNVESQPERFGLTVDENDVSRRDGDKEGQDSLDTPLLPQQHASETIPGESPSSRTTPGEVSFSLSTDNTVRRRWAQAGIRAIFVVQSNDLALGLPLMTALYSGTSHTDLVHYQYILTTIALVTTNPVGFFMIEYGLHGGGGTRNRKPGKDGTSIPTTGHQESGSSKFMFKVLFNVLRNSIVLSVILGILWNQAARRPLPSMLDQFFEMLGNSFDACALFTLGSSMVNRLRRITQLGVAYPMSLILSKTLLLPILCKMYLAILDVGPELSLYGFIYGTLPTAPVVFLWAQQFGLESEVIASMMVAGTIVFAPVLFLAANVLTLSNSDHARGKGETITGYAVRYISPVSLVSVTILLFVLSYSWYLRRKHRGSRRQPDMQQTVSKLSSSSTSGLTSISPLELLILALGFCYFISTITVLACQDSIHDDHFAVTTRAEIARFFFLYSSVLATRFGAAAIPVVLWVQHSYSERVAEYVVYAMIGTMLTVPAIGTLALLGIHEFEIKDDGYCGSSYTVGGDPFSAIVIALALLATLVFSILARRRHVEYLSKLQENAKADFAGIRSLTPTKDSSVAINGGTAAEYGACGCETIQETEQTTAEGNLTIYLWSNPRVRDFSLYDRLMLYCLYQIVSMSLAEAICLWIVFENSTNSSLEIVISYLDKALLFGQGMVLSAILCIMSPLTRGLGGTLFSNIRGMKAYERIQAFFKSAESQDFQTTGPLLGDFSIDENIEQERRRKHRPISRKLPPMERPTRSATYHGNIPKSLYSQLQQRATSAEVQCGC